MVLDELNAALKPHGLLFAPDVSTASRATIGGMIANNSSGARSVVYGKTIDHVRELKVVLADGRVAHLRPLIAEATGAGDLRRDGIEGARLPGDSAAWRRRMRDEIERRFPKILRRVGGYNLDAFVDPRRTPVRPRAADRRLRGHARLRRSRPRCDWCRCRGPRPC